VIVLAGGRQGGDDAMVAFLPSPETDQQSSRWQKIDNELTVIRGCHLLKQIGGRSLEKEIIVQAIQELNEHAREEIVRAVPTVVLESGSLEHASGHPIYCEHQALSLVGPGQRYTAVDIARAPDTRPISWEALELFLDFAAQCINLAGYEGKDRPAQKRLMDRQTHGVEISVLDGARQRLEELAIS